MTFRIAQTPNLAQFFTRINKAFREQKAGCQFLVVPRGSHGDGEPAPAEANFERLLNRQVIVARKDAAGATFKCGIVFDRIAHQGWLESGVKRTLWSTTCLLFVLGARLRYCSVNIALRTVSLSEGSCSAPRFA